MQTVATFTYTFFYRKNILQAFLVVGGMAMYLNDALASELHINTICCHHEQACALAAEGYAHMTGRPAIVQVTSGPGALNAMTGVFGAYVDGLPMIVISGQPKLATLCATYGLVGQLRQAGEQEAQIIPMAKMITKYAVSITDPTRIQYELEKALYISTKGRPGPVWIEIPVDVQGMQVDEDCLPKFHIPYTPCADLSIPATEVAGAIGSAKRPLLIAGPELHVSHAVEIFKTLAERLHCPVLCAGTLDIIQKDHPLYAGSIGNGGTRAGNINVQNADLLVFVGVTMHLTMTTYNWKALGKHAHKIVVNCDQSECERPQYIADTTILAETKPFLEALNSICLIKNLIVPDEWLEFCRERVHQLPAVPEHLHTVDEQGRINPYWFAEELFNCLSEGDIVVPGNASAGVTAQQAGGLRPSQRLIANFGSGPMGMAIPAAIGASASSPHKRVVCLDGDGSFMLNMQELATIKHNQLPIIVVIYNNNGYMSIRQTQRNFFKQKIGTDSSSGLGFPDFEKLAAAFDIPFLKISGADWLTSLRMALRKSGPLLIEAMLDPEQGFEPKISSRQLSDGRIVSLPPEDMFPFLDRVELQSHLKFPLDQATGIT
jgi:acetolactate synthase-1/2/3 large subunit